MLITPGKLTSSRLDRSHGQGHRNRRCTVDVRECQLCGRAAPQASSPQPPPSPRSPSASLDRFSERKCAHCPRACACTTCARLRIRQLLDLARFGPARRARERAWVRSLNLARIRRPCCPCATLRRGWLSDPRSPVTRHSPHHRPHFASAKDDSAAGSPLISIFHRFAQT